MSKRDKQLWVIIIALVLMLVVVVAGVWIYFGNNENKVQNNSIDVGENVDIFEEEEEVLTGGVEINTPCGTVFYPGKWEEYVVVKTEKETPYTVSVYAKIGEHEKQPLFDIIFGESFGDYFGNVKSKDGSIYPLYMRIFETDDLLGFTENELVTLMQMQEDANRIIGQFEFTDSAVNVETGSDCLKIKTDYVDLYYPSIWKDWLETEEENEAVVFYAKINEHEKEKLFSVVFGKDGDVFVGEIETKKETIMVSIDIFDLVFDETWSEEEQQIVIGMRESVNKVIEEISKDENFVSEP